MRFLGGKWRKKNAKAKTKAINQSLRPLGFAPVFGREVAPLARGCERPKAEALGYLEATANSSATAKSIDQLRQLEVLGEDFGEVFGSGVGVLGNLFAAAETVADDDGFGVVADGGEEDALA
jgi:hypothetical protein